MIHNPYVGRGDTARLLAHVFQDRVLLSNDLETLHASAEGQLKKHVFPLGRLFRGQNVHCSHPAISDKRPAGNHEDSCPRVYPDPGAPLISLVIPQRGLQDHDVLKDAHIRTFEQILDSDSDLLPF